jgi:hypothetical protein
MTDEIIIGNTFDETAFHEAGHIVLAGATGMPLKHSGITIYEVSEKVSDGYANYEENGGEKEAILMALLAGARAQLKQFPETRLVGTRSDEQKFRDLVKAHFGDRQRELSAKLIPQVDSVLKESWSAVTSIVTGLSESPWIPVLSSEHTKSRRKKQMNGHALAAILQRHGIPAKVCEEA